ncbi:MAG: squalene/phytoene synthase family protein [Gammaproteobacteria bacterium]
MTTMGTKAAYRHCLQKTRAHYENFPVAAIFLGSGLKKAISAVYAFARAADDIVDENIYPTQKTKQQALSAFRAELYNTQSQDPIFIALHHSIQTYQLPLDLFSALLDAFEQDIYKFSYQNDAELLAYCSKSANPIGRILLHLTQNKNPKSFLLSDMICTGLQLINFIQDLKSDIQERQRYYVPKGQSIAQQIERAEAFILAGRNLPDFIDHWGLKIQVKLVINLALKMLKKLKNRRSEWERPTLKWWEFVTGML